MTTRDENLLDILMSLRDRGVRYKVRNGLIRFWDPECVLREDEQAGLDLCRAALTDVYLRYRETARERVAEHVPATLHRSCYTPGGTCHAFSTEQFRCVPLSKLDLSKGCGDCDLFAVRYREGLWADKRAKKERREAAQWRANRFSLEAYEHDTDDDDERDDTDTESGGTGRGPGTCAGDAPAPGVLLCPPDTGEPESSEES